MFSKLKTRWKCLSVNLYVNNFFDNLVSLELLIFPHGFCFQPPLKTFLQTPASETSSKSRTLIWVVNAKWKKTKWNNCNNHEYKRVESIAMAPLSAVFTSLPHLILRFTFLLFQANKFLMSPRLLWSSFPSQVHVLNCSRCNLKIILHGKL